MESFSIRNFDCSRHYQDICHGQIPELWLHKNFGNVLQCLTMLQLSPSVTIKYISEIFCRHSKTLFYMYGFYCILNDFVSKAKFDSYPITPSSVPGPCPTININKFSPVVTLRLALTHCCDLSRG